MRAVTEDEFGAYIRTVQTAFGNHPTEEETAGWRSISEVERTLATFDGDQIVATAGAFTFELSTPGRLTVRAAGVTEVGVLPTHRRQGLLTALMRRQLDDIAEAGEPVAILTASESAIYGRFGYGAATFHRSVRIDPQRARFTEPLEDPGRVEVLDPVAAIKVIPAIHGRARLEQPGDIGRSDPWWALNVTDPPWFRRGAPEKFWAVHVSGAGEPDGYVAYRVSPSWQHGIPRAEVDVAALVGLDAAVELALWRYVLDLDLAGAVIARSRPLDEPLAARLADPRQLTTTSVTDQVWVRLLDIPEALGARSYVGEGEIVLEVSDTFRAASAGRFVVRTTGDQAECTTTDQSPDISLGVAELGSVYLGSPRLAILAGAGRVVEHTPGALHRADRLFGAPAIPFCRSAF